MRSRFKGEAGVALASGSKVIKRSIFSRKPKQISLQTFNSDWISDLWASSVPVRATSQTPGLDRQIWLESAFLRGVSSMNRGCYLGRCNEPVRQQSCQEQKEETLLVIGTG